MNEWNWQNKRKKKLRNNIARLIKCSHITCCLFQDKAEYLSIQYWNESSKEKNGGVSRRINKSPYQREILRRFEGKNIEKREQECEGMYRGKEENITKGMGRHVESIGIVIFQAVVLFFPSDANRFSSIRMDFETHFSVHMARSMCHIFWQSCVWNLNYIKM